MKPIKEPGPIKPTYPPRDPLPTSPWWHAANAIREGRDYITPEDISAAIDAGADLTELRLEVLVALGRRCCEDWSLCAFVAAEGGAP
jgi:hypothetical protein